MYKSISSIRWITLLLILILIQGCGFHLRQGVDLPPSISPVMIKGVGKYSGLGIELFNRLESSTVKVTEDSVEAKTTLTISNYKRQNRTLSVDSSGKLAQSELRHRLFFALTDKSGRILVPKQEITSVRKYINTEDAKIAKSIEASQLREGMEQELARKIITRIKAQLK